MADEFDHQTNNICSSGNWWDSSRTRFDSGGSSSTTSTGITSTSIGSFGSWAVRSDNNNNNDSLDSLSVSGSSNSMVFQDTHEKFHGGDDRGSVLTDHSLQMMGLGLSSQAMDWNQPFLRSEKPEGSFRSMLQEDQHLSSNTNYPQETVMALSPQQQQHFQWRTQQKMFSGGGEDDSPSINQGLSSISTSSNFQMDKYSSIYESTPSPSTMLQGFLGSTHHHHHQQQHDSPFENHNRSMDYTNYVANYGMNTNEVVLPKFSHFMRSTTTSPPKNLAVPSQNQLHFSNNAPFWNASATTTTAMSDHVPLSFLPHSLQQQSQFSMPPTFDEKPIKPNTSEVRNSSSSVKKNGSENSMKRPRNETSSSPLPAFKVRKEKMGDRITALQQLVSPFGKTDTASVLSEAIEYIKFLHDQVGVLSTPYMKSGDSIQHHTQDPEGQKQDLKSRGLCLVPISSTFPVTHETTVDFWTPTFGGTFR